MAHIVAARWKRACATTGWPWSAPVSLTLLLSVVLFGTLPQSFFPPQNDDYSRVNITLPPGSTLKQTEAVTDRVAASFQGSER